MRLFPLVGALLLLGIGSANQSSSAAKPIQTPHVIVTTTSSTNATSPAKIDLVLDVTPKPKMHVYAPGEKDTIPIGVTLDANPAIKPGKAAYPPPEKYFFPPLKLTQLVYSKPFRITVPVTIVNASSSKALTLTGTLEYQACDDAVCYVPKKVTVQWIVKAGD